MPKKSVETPEAAAPAANGAVVAESAGSTFVGSGASSDVLALLSDDPSVRAAMKAKVEAELASAEAAASSAQARIARCRSVLASFDDGGAPAPSIPSAGPAPAPKARGRGAAPATADATKHEVLKALAAVGKAGMSLGALRSACGGKSSASSGSCASPSSRSRCRSR